jgi:hypothetical protein
MVFSSVLEQKTVKSREQQEFLDYIRTKMVFSLRLRSELDEMAPVHIKSTEIESRFFVRDRKENIQTLVESGELAVTQKGNAFFYEALKPGPFDLSLLQVKPLPNDATTLTMIEHLKNTSLPDSATSTGYFDLFLRYKFDRPDLFFKVDSFCGRVHTPITNFHRTLRPSILLYNQPTTSLDVTTMQPLLLGKIIYKAIGKNEYSTWINEGKDIYRMLQGKANLQTRDQAKKKFFEILFSKPSNALSGMFGKADWINWINDFKRQELNANPHYKDKPHSNLAWLLQTTEVKIMRKVWDNLVADKIPFLSIHDEIITTAEHMANTEQIMSDVLSKEFRYFNINTEKLLIEPVSDNSQMTAHENVSPEVLQIHAKYTEAEQRGALIDHPDTNIINSLWQGMVQYRNLPNRQQHYIDQLNNIQL